MVEVIFGVQGEIFGQWYGVIVDLVQVGIGWIEVVGDVWEQDGFVMLQQGLEGVCQYFVGVVVYEYFVCVDVVGGVVVGNGQFQGFGVGVGIQVQVVVDFVGDGLQGQW